MRIRLILFPLKFPRINKMSFDQSANINMYRKKKILYYSQNTEAEAFINRNQFAVVFLFTVKSGYKDI